MENDKIMDNLQQYFRQNSGSIKESDELIPEGDESRFEQRWEYSSRNRIHFRSNLKRRKKPLWKVLAFPLVASLALIFGVRMLMNPYIREDEPGTETMIVLSDTLSPSEVYNVYYDRMQAVMDEIYDLTANLENEDPNQVYMTVDIITREAIPLIDQLPEEMDDADKIAVLTKYSLRRIEALDAYRRALIANNNNI